MNEWEEILTYSFRQKLVSRNNLVVSDNFYPLLYLGSQSFNRTFL